MVMDVRIIGVGSVGEAPGEPHAEGAFIEIAGSAGDGATVTLFTVPLSPG
jgi:pyrimidine deaminase RibD-like protein